MAEHENYRKDQEDAQKLWRENNPGYWKEYRKRNPEYTERNRQKQRERNRSSRAQTGPQPTSGPVAKMDASIAKMDAPNSMQFPVVGQYWLVPVIAKMDSLKVNIVAIADG